MLHPARFPIIKPTRGTLINRNHPLARGLVLSVLLNQMTGNRIADGYDAWTFESGVGWDDGRLWFPGEDYDKCKLSISAGDNNYGLDEQTILIAGQIASLTNSDGDSDLALFSEFPSLLVVENTGIIRFEITTTSAYNRAQSSAVLSDGDRFIICATTSGIGNSPSPKVYLAGTDVTNTSTVGSGAPYSTAGLLCLGHSNDFTWANQFYGHVDFVYRWDRCLSPAEVAYISRNPFCIFEQLSRSKYFNVVAGTTHNLSASLTGQSTTPSIAAITARALAAAIDSASQTSDILATTLRTIAAAIENASLTPAAQALLSRALLAAIAGQSVTPDISATLQGIISFLASISGSSATPDIAALTARRLAAGILGQSGTPAVSANVLRTLLASAAGGSMTPDDLILLLAGLGLILDPSIDSLTVQRTISSLTVQRTIHCL